jgi:hypothetical protein
MRPTRTRRPFDASVDVTDARWRERESRHDDGQAAGILESTAIGTDVETALATNRSARRDDSV